LCPPEGEFMPDDASSDLMAGLPALDRLSLSDIRRLDQPVLAAVLERCKNDAARPNERFTAFSNFVTADEPTPGPGGDDRARDQ
jgi:hypothetical protein